MLSLLGKEKLELLARLAEYSPAGAFVEVGVYKGGSALILYSVAQKQARRLYLYDTFAGIPYAGQNDSHKAGDFSDGISEHEARLAFPDAYVSKGIFPDGYVPDELAFVHLDVDQEKSYTDALAVLEPALVPGGMILCDDYVLRGAAMAIDTSPLLHCHLNDGRMLLLKKHVVP